ncbi:MAG: hypothetical protein LBD33_02100 [Puniceicoccales bacterium]|nr:hypothetical protein [Puniceicoccales bacterium]
MGNAAQIYFNRVPAKLNKDGRHFEEDLQLGQCSLGFESSGAAEIFNKYNLACVRESDCPEIIAFAKLWTFEGEGDLSKRVVALDGGEYEIDVPEGSCIGELFRDSEFQKL